MKINVSGDEMDPMHYDRDNGPGAANQIVEAIKKAQILEFKKALPEGEIESAAAAGDIEEAAELAMKSLRVLRVYGS